MTKIRGATFDDIDLLQQAIFATEQVPIGISVYEAIYGLTDAELRDLSRASLEREGAIGHQLALSSFSVAEIDGCAVGCCASWLEASGSPASGTLLAMILSRFVGMARFRERAAEIRELAATAPRRTPGALQLETIYVDPAHRRKGLTTTLMSSAIQAHAKSDSAQVVEISFLCENSAARAVYESQGFSQCWQSPISERFRQLTGSNGFLQYQRPLHAPLTTLE